MNPLLVQFLSEARELLEEASSGLLALEERPGDHATMNRVFRAVHTLKGSSGLFEEFAAITRVVHAGEDLLDGVRGGKLALNAEMMDQLLNAVDLVNVWIDSIESAGRLPEGAEREGEVLAGKLRDWLSAGKERVATKKGPEKKLLRPLPWLASLPEEGRLAAVRRCIGEETLTLLAFVYQPDSQCFFTGDDPLLQVRQIPELLALQVAVAEEWPALEQFDPYHCVLHLYGLSVAPESALRELFRYQAEQLQLVEIAPSFLMLPTGTPGESELLQDFADAAQDLVDEKEWNTLREAAANLLALLDPGWWQASVLRWLLVVLEGAAQPRLSWVNSLLQAFSTGQAPQWPAVEQGGEAHAPVPQAKGGETESGEGRPRVLLDDRERGLFFDILRTQARILEMPCVAEDQPGRLHSVARVLRNCFARAGLAEASQQLQKAVQTAGEACQLAPLRRVLEPYLGADRSAGQPVEEGQGNQEAAPKWGRRADDRASSSEPATTAQGKKTLRVDQERIDRIMDLVGELVVAKNSIAYLASRAESEYQVRALSRDLKEQYGVVNRISEDLQSAVMQVRMLPVSFIFQRFPRLVRDLSRKLDKQINLQVLGESTEADKNVIEDLSDPLIHLVRNSLDHGIEMPAERIRVGKPPEGTIRLLARQEGDEVIIEIQDDGKGIDAQAVKQKALDKGLITQERAESMSEQEAVELILQPGFSMAKEITDLSGRGVGMDVVNSAVERAGGSLTINSEKGVGSTVRLSLPMSMAVTRVMMIKQNSQLYGVPFDIVLETVRASRQEIHVIKDQEAIVLRGKLIPLRRLAILLNLPRAEQEQRELEAVLVVRVNDEDVGIIVDDFAEGVDIILKKMEGIVAGMTHFSGTALLGDGSVLLVLNLKELL
ncbi:MAG: chemotaxis protein CheA [Magnetococcales bacterium]|nr:chemotaxis protein CheA [Magnetococcales bacterium]MBF0114231.1 chemotaxis protein CheA [Magnetococcales bacterium]